MPHNLFPPWNKFSETELSDASFETVHSFPMQEETGQPIALAEIISALSVALDMTEDAVPGHAVRCCLLGMRVGEALELSEEELGDLYYALLLKDIGCSSNAARMCQILGGDERKAKRETKLMDRSQLTWNGVRVAWSNTLPGEPRFRRAGRFFRAFMARKKIGKELIELRCERGATIALKMGFSEGCANGIHDLDEYWDGSGQPGQKRGSEIPTLAQILAISQHLDVFANEYGRKEAIRTLKAQSGMWFNPELVTLVVALDRSGKLWQGIGTPQEHALLLAMEPGIVRFVDSRGIDLICEGFADVVDAKSTYTYSHSLGVAKAALKIARQLGLAPEDCRLVYRASLLHDLGKLSVPNVILDKPARLDAAEWKIMRGHPEHSQAILEKIPSFAPIAQIVGRHHERLDGSGYPLGLSSKELTLPDRIVSVADIYGALSEDRPYRKALPTDEVLALMEDLVPGRVDAHCFRALVATLK